MNPPQATTAEVQLDAILTLKECAAWMHMTPRSLRERAERGYVPFIPIGKKGMRFHPRTILSKQK